MSKLLRVVLLVLLCLTLVSAVKPVPILPTVQLYSPNGGEMWNGGESHNVMWVFSPGTCSVNSLSIELSRNGGATWILIQDNIPPAATPWLWKVPDADGKTEQAVLRIRLHYIGSKGNPQYIEDVSDAFFTLYPTPGPKWWRELQ